MAIDHITSITYITSHDITLKDALQCVTHITLHHITTHHITSTLHCVKMQYIQIHTSCHDECIDLQVRSKAVQTCKIMDMARL